MKTRDTVLETIAAAAIALFITVLCLLWFATFRQSLDRALFQKTPPPAHASE